MFRKLALIAALVLWQSVTYAEGQAIGIKAGALGLGVEYTHELSERLAFRVGLNGSRVGFDSTESGIRYNFDFVFDSLSANVDFHPLKSPFRLTLGLLRDGNRLDGESTPISNIMIGDATYTPQQVGTLFGRVDFDRTAPFAGVGWDWSRKRRHFGMALDIGVLDQGSPHVALRGTGTLLGDPAFAADIAKEEAQLRDSLSGLDVVPYLTLGFQFRF